VDEARAVVAYRVFHRTVATNPPTLGAFLSNKAKGLPPRAAEVDDPSLWDGISVMDTLERALKRARQFPMHGTFVAELTISPDAPIRATRTLKTPGHYTLHASPQVLLNCVTQVFPVEPQHEAVR
jgi:hypothetical protein